MSEVFIGQVMMAGFNFAPKFFAQCNGQWLPINQNQALFSLLGTTYGGNGQTAFALPDLRGRTPVGFASSIGPGTAPKQLGEVGGTETVTLLANNLPAHTHGVNASTGNGDSRIPSNRVHATSIDASAPKALYGPASGAQVAMAAQTIGMTGGTQPHANMQPYSVINFCIALSGIFPPRS
ncbi:phage tail protein [Lysobacter cavernae]|uniref:Phage tail protein n=1 Tax=Lysobacter cavernae TaxID=1685901 RepID=A0ABV7RTL0_9GAMM